MYLILAKHTYYDVPLGRTVACTASIFLLRILGDTGMRRAKAGVSPLRRSLSCNMYDMYERHHFHASYTPGTTVQYKLAEKLEPTYNTSELRC